jgi:hypothetical protein
MKKTTYEFVDCQKIRLGKRIFDFEYFREVINRAVSTLKRKLSLVLETTGGVDANGNALALVFALGHGLNVFEVTNCPGEKLHINNYVSRLKMFD